MLLNADNATKRVPINKLIERIDVTNENIIIRFKINLNDFFPKPRISDGFAVAWFCLRATKKGLRKITVLSVTTHFTYHPRCSWELPW